MPFKLLVLAGGFGTRLHSLLPDTPKAMAPIGTVPFLALQLDCWVTQGIRSFVFLLHHKADQILSFLESNRDGLLRDCEVISLIEPKPMGTGGAVAYAVRELGLDGNFLVTNADTWLNSGIRELTALSAPAMAVVQLSDSSRYGQVEFDQSNQITAFTEKNTMDAYGWVNAGLYLLCADIFNNWDGAEFSLEREVFPKLAKHAKFLAVAIDSDFIDIGIPSDYERFCRWIIERRREKLCD